LYSCKSDFADLPNIILLQHVQLVQGDKLLSSDAGNSLVSPYETFSLMCCEPQEIRASASIFTTAVLQQPRFILPQRTQPVQGDVLLLMWYRKLFCKPMTGTFTQIRREPQEIQA
jgi:hypothetical protein